MIKSTLLSSIFDLAINNFFSSLSVTVSLNILFFNTAAFIIKLVFKLSLLTVFNKSFDKFLSVKSTLLFII